MTQNDLTTKLCYLTDYKLLSCLHEGPSSIIYRAVRVSDELPVVVKVGSQKKAQQFQHEFEIGKKIQSLHVVQNLELKRDLAYGTALVMEDDKSDALSSVIPKEGFSNCEFLDIAMQIVAGLKAIHTANIIHNDINANNILIHPTTRHIKIIDFNRASSLQQEIPEVVSTHSGVGTLAYISPEQTGRINRSVDYRTDFYSLGVTFYLLLTGRFPFMAEDPLELVHQHLAKPPLPPSCIKPMIPQPLSEMVMKLLEKEAENRYQSCDGILHDFAKCQSALKKSGTIPTFELGQQDFSPKLTLFRHLYGREKEINVLMRAFTRVSEGGQEVIMVAGEPGVGKSMLIQELQKPITLRNGYFITGKFDRMNKNLAYSALTQAFDGLIKQLLIEDEASIELWQNRLLSTLGSHAQLVIQMVPTLALLISQQPPAQVANQSQAKTVFNLVFLEFVKLFADATHPLVLFLDDLQWADNASMELMAYLLQQPKLTHLLWVGAYRDNETTSSHPTLQAIAALQDAQMNIQTLSLTPLRTKSLRQWIGNSLHMSEEEVAPLTKLIQQKTAGNPFFVKVFLEALYNKHLLTFSSLTYRWEWDLAKILQHPATENVITLMTYQIKQLPADTQKALMVISCLGHHVELGTSQIAMEASPEVIYEILFPALHGGFLLLPDGEMHFAHDRVQEAAYGLLEEGEKARTHLMIGRRLLAHSGDQGSRLFDIVGQFNRSQSLINDPQERLKFAKLNLKAGQKAKQATAYLVALDYLHEVQNWVDTQALWKTDYPLAFSFHQELAETEFLCGHMDTSQNLIACMQPHLQSTLDKVEVYHLLIIQKTLQGQQREAITLGHQALQLLGSGLPLDNPTVYIHHEAPLLRQKLAERSLSSLLDLPLIVEPEKQAIFKILADLSSACYQIGSELLSATTLMAINLTLNYGHVPESCVSYVVYGLLLCVEHGEYSLGFQFGNFAIQIAEKLHAPVQRCRSALFFLDFIYAWSKSIQDLPSMLATEFEQCLACGEIEYAGYCGDGKVHMSFDQGANLSKVQQEITSNLQFAHSTNTTGVIYNVMRGYQRVLNNLTGETPSEKDFDYNHETEAEFQHDCNKSASGMALGLYHIRKAQALYIYGYADQALIQINLARDKLDCMLGFYATATFNWYDSLARLALYPKVSSEEQQIFLQQIHHNQQQMHCWQNSCPENFAHKYRLVEAELARIKGLFEQADAKYDLAMIQAGQNGFVQEQAVAAELAAKFWLARGKALCAQGYLNTAFNSYKQWGAKHKLALLKAQYPDLMQALAPPGLSQLVINQETTLSGNTLKFLDLSSILKASHALSSDIELSKLLRNMMDLIIVTAGAQQGAVLFVEADESIFVQAEYDLDGAITTSQKIPMALWSHGALSVIQYVKRMHRPVVVENAATHELFNSDPYISRIQAKSILCIPILKQTELIAILYAENNLMSSAFTPERVQTVLILTSQMAISLQNARYFAEQLELTRQLAEQSTRAQIAEESLQVMSHDYKLALQASKAGTFNWQIDQDIITWDDTNYSLFGLKPGEFKGTYQAVMDCVRAEDREELDRNVRRCVEQDTPCDTEFRVIWPDGSQHFLATKGRVYRNKDGRPIKMAGVCVDFTQKKLLEEDRVQALRQAEEKERRRAEDAEKYRRDLEDFIDMVCHEIRNPMSGIYGNIDFLQQTVTSLRSFGTTLSHEFQATYSRLLGNLEQSTLEITQCVTHQKAIIDDVLDLSQLEAGKTELKNRPFRLKTLIKEAALIFAAPFAQKKVALGLALSQSDPWVKADMNHLKMVLINLMSNALKFTQHGEVKISLHVLESNAKHTTFTLSVEDTGLGMTPEEQCQLFQRFARASSAEYQGSGLGLLLSKRFIERMGGHIEVKSEKGQGSQFTVFLTCESAAPQAKQAPQVTPPPPVSPTFPTTKRILVVEDNSVNQRILSKQLQTAGYLCDVANNGQEAVEKWSSARFDLIFMDIQMPVMGGIEATQVIRQREEQQNLPNRVPIVGLSAYSSVNFVQQAHAVGMNDYITKPYDKAKILEAAKRWIDAVQIH